MAQQISENELYFLRRTKDGPEIIDCIGIDAAMEIEAILTAYNQDKIDLIVPRYDDGDREPDFEGEFDIEVKDQEYILDGREIVLLRWYEDYGEDMESVIYYFGK